MEIFYYCFDKLENVNPKQNISIIVIQQLLNDKICVILKRKKNLQYSNNVSKKISFFSINKEKKNLQHGNNL